jgi:Skp family chaperone for outer membrane proteins
MKKTMTLVAAAFLALGASQAWALRIATIDVKKAFDAYNGTQTAKDKLKAQVDSEKDKLEAERDAIKKELSDLQSKKSVMTDEKYKEQEQKVMAKVNEVQDKIQTTTADLQAQESKLTGQIVDLIKEATRKVAKNEKYDYVFESSNVLFGAEDDDITGMVIKELNSK